MSASRLLVSVLYKALLFGLLMAAFRLLEEVIKTSAA